MKIRILFTTLLLCLVAFSYAAHIDNVPRVLIQPNGDTLRCFVSGDEFYLRLHDEKGFTIVQDKQTGYYVYAEKRDGQVIPTAWVAGTCNPADKGLQPGVRISKEQYLERRREMVMPAKVECARNENTNKGNMNNIVIFIRFADDTDFTNSFADVNYMFNDSSENYTTNSMFNYFRTTSYHQLFIRSSFYPQPDGDQILSYQDIHPRAYYREWSSENPEGYDASSNQRTEREHGLLERACNYVENMVPANLNMDYDNDGKIDNIVFVVKGDVGDWAVLLWPHRWSLFSKEVYMHGKRAYDYNFQLADATGYFNTSTLCHEMFHTLSAPDLYHYVEEFSDVTAVGPWDLMGSNQTPPQQPCAYMKYKYGNWLSESDILPLDHYGTYTIMPLNSETPDRQSYFARTQIPTELIMVDFRSKTQPFDSSVPGRGLVFYRVNTLFNGNANYNGDDNLDEIYVFRRNGTPDNNGLINNANHRSGIAARKEFSPLTNPYPFLENGEFVPVFFNNLTNDVDSMQFDFTEWVGIQDYANSSYALYPNPAQQFITLTTSNEGEHTFQLYTLFGQMLQEVNTMEMNCRMDVSNLPAGYYLIKVLEREKHITTLKFIKQ